MSTPDPVPPPAYMGALQSPILRGLLVALLTHVLAALHVTSRFTPADVSNWVDITLEIATVVALFYAGRARLTQKSAPQITLTKAKADSLNATQPPENPQ